MRECVLCGVSCSTLIAPTHTCSCGWRDVDGQAVHYTHVSITNCLLFCVCTRRSSTILVQKSAIWKAFAKFQWSNKLPLLWFNAQWSCILLWRAPFTLRFSHIFHGFFTSAVFVSRMNKKGVRKWNETLISKLWIEPIQPMIKLNEFIKCAAQIMYAKKEKKTVERACNGSKSRMAGMLWKWYVAGLGFEKRLIFAFGCLFFIRYSVGKILKCDRFRVNNFRYVLHSKRTEMSVTVEIAIVLPDVHETLMNAWEWKCVQKNSSLKPNFQRQSRVNLRSTFPFCVLWFAFWEAVFSKSLLLPCS